MELFNPGAFIGGMIVALFSFWGGYILGYNKRKKEGR